MSRFFDLDDLPGRPRILFVGFPDSTHTHAWIDMVRDLFNVRLYSLPRGFPPHSWPVRTYITQSTPDRFDPDRRRKLYPFNRVDRDVRNWLVRLAYGQATDAPRLGLARAIRQWKPHVVHALGLDPAGRFVRQVRERFGLGHGIAWLLQLRGGSDLALSHLDPAQRPGLAGDLTGWDVLLTDNQRNMAIASDLGIPRERFASMCPVPGTGGLETDAMDHMRQSPTSSRRDILWPKAYECPWSKALPVFEGLRSCWDSLGDCTVHMLAADEEARAWHRALPAHMRERCLIKGRIPRQEALGLMGRCRVMLAPSLVDGVPNSLYEAMALGAFPIVSPLETITPLVREGSNVLFARNLHPDEIARALARAMSEDSLVDTASLANFELVHRLADRSRSVREAKALYEELAVSDRSSCFSRS